MGMWCIDLSQLPIGVIEGKKESEYLVNLRLALKFSRDGQRMKQYREKSLLFGTLFLPPAGTCRKVAPQIAIEACLPCRNEGVDYFWAAKAPRAPNPHQEALS